MSDNHDLERELSEILTEGEMAEEQSKEEKGRQLISPKYEVRIQTKYDPVVEETRKYRTMGRELDDRYDKYMDKVDPDQPKSKPDKE